MTKPEKAARRADDWTFNMSAGTAQHGPSGVLFRFYPHWHAVLDDPVNKVQPWETVPIEGEPWVFFGSAAMPEEVVDRRPAHLVDRGDANAPGLREWIVIAPDDQIQAALDRFAQEHGQPVAKPMLNRLAREAGERWIFRARLERGWTDGRRAT